MIKDQIDQFSLRYTDRCYFYIEHEFECLSNMMFTLDPTNNFKHL